MEVKGTALRSIMRAIEAVEGREGLETVLRAMPADARAMLEPVVLGARWYPIGVQAALHEALRSTLGRGHTEVNYRIAIRAAHDDFANGVYRIFLRAITYDALWDITQRMWLRYNSKGVIEFSERSRHSALGRIHGVAGYTLPMWMGVCGRLHALVELGGGKGVLVNLEAHDARSCTLRATWS